jgi:hypothetical protein
MDRFLENAARILEGGRSAVQAGCSSSAWTVLIAREGGIRMVADSDWPLDSLAREAGAEMASSAACYPTGISTSYDKACWFVGSCAGCSPCSGRRSSCG